MWISGPTIDPHTPGTCFAGPIDDFPNLSIASLNGVHSQPLLHWSTLHTRLCDCWPPAEPCVPAAADGPSQRPVTASYVSPRHNHGETGALQQLAGRKNPQLGQGLPENRKQKRTLLPSREHRTEQTNGQTPPTRFYR